MLEILGRNSKETLEAGAKMNGPEILEKVRTLYAGFDSYQDVGTVESPGLPGPGLEFETYFQRPGKFKFHWLSWHPRFGKSKPAKTNTVWTDGQNFKSEWCGEIRKEESFSMMLAGATGISRGSVHTIFHLLVPENHGHYYVWQEMSQIRSLPEEVINGVECFHIIGTNKTPDDTEAWIEKETFLVRQMKETLITTEAEAEAIRAEALEQQNIEMLRTALKKVNLPEEEIEKTIARQATIFKPGTSQHIYSYAKIIVNMPIDENLFLA